MRRALSLLIGSGLLCGALMQASCKQSGTETSERSPPLALELLALDSALAPRGPRPLVAGEDVHIALSVRGGKAPYEVQVATSAGDPRLATASATLPASAGPNAAAGLKLTLGSEVLTGSYRLTIRVSDDEGRAAKTVSEPFDVIGSDAPVHPSPQPPLYLRVVDVAGRARRTFFQGEAIKIRATLAVPQEVAIAIVAPDERPFMPARRYPEDELNLDLPLQVPRLARVGRYRVDMATSDEQSSVAIDIAGARYPAVSKPSLTNLNIYGGPDFRIPQTAVLSRGKALRIEAVVGGIQHQGTAQLRLRTPIGKQVDVHVLPTIVPADTNPEARTFLRTQWTPPTELERGRHMLELEIEEDGQLSTLYREIVLQ